PGTLLVPRRMRWIGSAGRVSAHLRSETCPRLRLGRALRLNAPPHEHCRSCAILPAEAEVEITVSAMADLRRCCSETTPEHAIEVGQIVEADAVGDLADAHVIMCGFRQQIMGSRQPRVLDFLGKCGADVS